MSDLSPDFLIGWVFGYLRTAALKAAIDLDIFTAIAEGATDVHAIAARTGAAERSVGALCDLLASGGVIEKKEGRYGLPLAAAMFLDRRLPTYMGSAHDFLASPLVMNLALRDPTSIVREGRPVFADVMADQSVWVNFAETMQGFVAPVADLAAWTLTADVAATRRILDVAAGHGIFGITLAGRQPGSEVTAIDWEPVLRVASANAEKAGMGSRYHTIPGDAFKVDWGSGYDLVFLANFLHHFGESECLEILAKARAALAPGGRVALVEFIPAEDRISPPFAAIFSFVMTMVTPSGNAYTASQLQSLLERSGFGPGRVVPLPPTPQSLVIANRD